MNIIEQYAACKRSAPDALLLFRVGDFCELFDDDAEEAVRILGLTLTVRRHQGQETPMAGFPRHSLDAYLAKLVRSGRRVAICDPVDDPKDVASVGKREITRTVVQGTLFD